MARPNTIAMGECNAAVSYDSATVKNLADASSLGANMIHELPCQQRLGCSTDRVAVQILSQLEIIGYAPLISGFLATSTTVADICLTLHGFASWFRASI